jgi:rhodanese-related sulfurtransferase
MMFPMKWKVLLGVLLSLVMVMGTFTTSCKRTTGSGKIDNVNEYEVIREAADAWVNNGKPITLTAQEMYDQIMSSIGLTNYKIEWYDPLTYQAGPLIVDVRSGNTEQPDPYTSGHIPGSFSIPWRSIADSNSLRKLDKSRTIALVSDTGMTGAMAAAVLGVLGYDTYDLKWGMTAWTSDPLAAPGRYDADRDTVLNWLDAEPHDILWGSRPPIYYHPIINNTDSTDSFDILQTAAIKWLSSGKRENMSAAELFHSKTWFLYADPRPFITNPMEPWNSSYKEPLILDVRDDEAYQNGHFPHVGHCYYKKLFKPGVLEVFDPEWPILVISDNGHESAAVTPLLNMLGYDAINLKWGIGGWTRSLSGKDAVPIRFNADTDVMNFTILTGYQSYLPCPG